MGRKGERQRSHLYHLWAKTSHALELITVMVFLTVDFANTVLLVDHLSGQTFKETES